MTTPANAAGLYLYSRLATALLGLAAIAIATRVYDDRSFAYVATILLLYQTAYALGSLGLPEAVFFFVGRDRQRAPAVVRQASLLLLAVAIPVIAVVVAVGYAIAKPEVDVVPALPWLVVALVCAMPTQPAVNQLLAVGRARAASILQATFALLEALAMVIPMASDLDVTWTPVLLALATSARLAVHAYLLRVVFPDPGRWVVARELRAMLAFAGPAGLATLCGKLNSQVDKYVVNLVLSTQVFAFYTAASWELPLVSMIPYAIGAVMQVRYVELYAQGRLRELHALWLANVEKTALVVLPVTVFVIAMAPALVELLFGAAYLPATLPFQLFSAVLLHRVASYGAMLQATNQTRNLLVTSVLLVGTNAMLTLPLTWLLGYPGAALATLLANIPPWLWTLSRIAQAMKVGMREVLPWRSLARTLVLAAAIGLAVELAVAQLALSPGPRLALAALAFTSSYLAVALRLGSVTRADLAYLGRWLSFRLR
ncbi:MAG: oligosaccharide flippase family protein [Kofleriaceae bacterium]